MAGKRHKSEEIIPKLRQVDPSIPNLEYVLRDIQTNRANLFHGWLFSSGSSNTAMWHITMPAEEPSTASTTDIRANRAIAITN